MAVIGKIRERSTLVLIIIGLAIVAFVLTDLFSAGTSGQQGPINLAEIDGKAISAQDFDFKVKKAYDNYQLNSQSTEPLDERTKSSIREQVWNEMVSDILLGEEMEQLGINVTSEELMDMVSGDNPHPQVKQAFTDPNTGSFNSQSVIQFIQNLDNDPKAKEQWISFERALKRNKHIEKYNGLVKKGLYTPSVLASSSANETNTKIDFSYVYKAYSTIVDSTVSVSEKEVKSYYNDHLADFEQKENRKAFYAYFPVRPSAMDMEMAKKSAFEIYENFKTTEDDSVFVLRNSDADFDAKFYSKKTAIPGLDTSLWNKEVGYITAPFLIEKSYHIQKVRAMKMASDSVKASHILINIADRTIEEAEVIADSLLKLLNSGGDMESLAKENSDDVGSGANGGDLGWFVEGTMVKPFNDVAFSAKVGEFNKAISQFGVHIIEVTDQTELVKKIQIASVRRDTEASKDTYEEIFNVANSFSINAKDLESFNNLVNEQNVQRRLTVLTENDNLIQGEAASRDLVRWIKEASEGDVSEAYDLDNAFAVAVVDEINNEGPSPLEKVRTTVEFEAKKIVKGKMIADQFNGASLEEIASSNGVQVTQATGVTFVSPVIQGIGIEPNVIGKAYGLEKGQMSVPIIGDKGVFVIKINNKTSIENPDLTLTRTTISKGNSARVDNGALFNAIKETSNIEDNRSKFY